MLRFIRLAVMALAVLSMPPAHALFGDDEARKAILDLRKQVQDMEKRLQDMQGKGVDLGGRMERLEGAQRGSLEIANQLDALRQDIAKLRGQVDRLQELLNEAVRTYPQEPDIHHLMGWVCTQQARYDEAIIHFQEAVRLKPDYAEALNGRGTALQTLWPCAVFFPPG